MSESFVNQITLDCLLNKEMYSKHLRSTKTKQINKEERKFYRKRIYNLFKEIISGNPPKDLAPDVKYSYDNFVNSSIQYFKTVDNNDIIQSEYTGFDFSLEESNKSVYDLSANEIKKNQADLLLTRSIKIEVPTLDKYVTRTRIKKKEEIILPQQKEINLKDPELKNKGLKKNNIDNMYEDKNPKKKNDENKNVKDICDKNNEK
jgi:hypothetical protein